MDKSVAEKQAYLKKEILKQNYDAAQFYQFLNSKVVIGDNLALCTFQELQLIVKEFIQKKKNERKSQKYSSDLSQMKSPLVAKNPLKQSPMRKTYEFPSSQGYESNQSELKRQKSPNGKSSVKSQFKQTQILNQNQAPSAFTKQMMRQARSEMTEKPVINLQDLQFPIYDSPVPTKQPRNVFFVNYHPHLVEKEFQTVFECVKIRNRYDPISSISCVVSDPQRKNTGGLFGIGATSFLVFKVTTHELQWAVERRYSDFVWLRLYLMKTYPSYIIPPIPEKKAAKRTQLHIEKRMKILQYFLNDIVHLPEIFNNKYVKGFLSIEDNDQFEELKSQANKQEPFNSISDHINLGGRVRSRLTEENKNFMEEMKQKIPKFQQLYKAITRKGKQLQTIITDQVNTIYETGNLFADFQEQFLGFVEKLPGVGPISDMNELLITMNNMMVEWGNLTRNQISLLQKNFNTFFKYTRNELFGFSEVLAKEQQFENQFAKAKLLLERKKNKLLLFDEARKLQKIKHNAFYFLDQFYVQGVRNIGRQNHRVGENFREFCVQMKKNNGQIVEMWQDILKNFLGQTKKKSIIPSTVLEHPNQIKVQELFDD